MLSVDLLGEIEFFPLHLITSCLVGGAAVLCGTI